ncbi:MAG: phosphatidylinositol-specific phospholipase C/glycerophosphodiester phosphodiesterase family protein [Oceanococcaceae bacterium]
MLTHRVSPLSPVHLRRASLALLGLLLAACSGDGYQGRELGDVPTPLYQAHAHNDYEHDLPLLEALGHGFMSVEADVFVAPLPAEVSALLPNLPLAGQLYVAHDPQDIRPERTLDSLYLQPLWERFSALGAIYPEQDRPLQLLVDFKTEAETTWQALEARLQDYLPMLSRIDNGQSIEGAVRIVISGNRPTATLASLPTRAAFIDGRLSDLDQPQPVELMPLISDNWGNHFSWTGDGPMPAEEQTQLLDIVQRTHALGASLRFWATPDAPGPEREAVWTVLADAGQDHINTDDLAGLAAFLRERE